MKAVNDTNTALVIFFVGVYNQQKSVNRTYIPDTGVARVTLTAAYKEFVKDGSLVAIEDLTPPEKENLSRECRLQGMEFTNESLVRQCRTLHLIRLINNNT